MLWVWVSQPGSSTEQPNPQIPDITSSSRPGPSASPSPSFLSPLWGQGRDSGLAQFRKDHPTHQGLTHSRAGLSGRPHPHVKASDKGAQGPAEARVPPTGNICKAFMTNEETETYSTLASTFPEAKCRLYVWGKGPQPLVILLVGADSKAIPEKDPGKNTACMPARPDHHVWLPESNSLDTPLRLSSAWKFSGPFGLDLPWATAACQQPTLWLGGPSLGRRMSGQEVPAPFFNPQASWRYQARRLASPTLGTKFALSPTDTSD